MRWTSPKLWIGVFSVAAVSMFAVVDARRTSPGPVSAVHAGLDEIDGGTSCSACHGGWFSDMTDACLECHAPIQDQLATRTGIHGLPEPEAARQCGTCHGEHHGAGFALVNDRAFRLVGAEGVSEFDHELVGFTMNGRHLEIGCADCHEHANVVVLQAGTRRFQGLDQDCGSCHEDPHEGRMQVACAQCHGQTKWDELFSLGHEKHLPLVGGHGDVSCRKCHDEKDAHSLESMGDRGPRPNARDCIACHMSPHTSVFSAAVAEQAGMALGASCVACHAAEHTLFREPSLAISAEQHAASGYPLDPPHHEALCADCHDPKLAEFQARYPGRPSEACSACHADPHGGQFATGPFANQECTACHDRAHFEPSAFTTEQHALSRLVLDGKHLEAKCHDCHLDPPPGSPRLFLGTNHACDACHLDSHGGFFDEALAATELPAHGACQVCHTTQAFAEIPAPGFDHEHFTDFALQGAHEQSECAACHPTMPKADESGRHFGRVEEHFGTFTGCVTCHADPHKGLFDAPGLPADFDGRTDCARCHDETSFRAFPHGFDHGRWTGFQLVGAHGAAQCSACHEPLRIPDAAGRTWQPAMGAKCSDCHFDPHAGQFDARGPDRCAHCHVEVVENYLSFNHDRDSRFPLREQHAELDCAACHKTWTSPTGEEVVRYRPLGRECVDCHGVQEDVLMKRKRRRSG